MCARSAFSMSSTAAHTRKTVRRATVTIHPLHIHPLRARVGPLGQQQGDVQCGQQRGNITTAFHPQRWLSIAAFACCLGFISRPHGYMECRSACRLRCASKAILPKALEETLRHYLADTCAETQACGLDLARLSEHMCCRARVGQGRCRKHVSEAAVTQYCCKHQRGRMGAAWRGTAGWRRVRR